MICNLEKPARTQGWGITCVTSSNEIFIFTSIGTQMVLKKQISNGGFLYNALFSLGQVESWYGHIFFINMYVLPNENHFPSLREILVGQGTQKVKKVKKNWNVTQVNRSTLQKVSVV